MIRLPSDVAAVVVTYGHRKFFLERVVQSLLSQGVARIVVVDNGAQWDVSSIASEAVHVVKTGNNLGSAAGFAVGLECTLARNAEMIWLMDDDLAPEEGCLKRLLQVFEEHSSPAPLAVLAARRASLQSVCLKSKRLPQYPRTSSFLGVSISDILPKIIERLRQAKRSSIAAQGNSIRLRVATYGGLLFHRSLIELIGLPRTDYVLYVDDLEFTYRITAKGGQIVLVTTAVLDELELTWSSRGSHKSAAHSLLFGPAFRVYYTVRNMTNFERRQRDVNLLGYFANRTAYLCLLFTMALFCGRVRRFRLLMEAIWAGSTGRLGIDSRFPLP